MNDVWVVELAGVSELVLRAIAMGAVVLLALEAVYLLIFSVFVARNTREHLHRPRKGATKGVTVLLLMLFAAGPALAQSDHRPRTPVGLDEYFPVPEDNPFSSAKVALGKRLFLDPLLSADRTLSCASCHRPAQAYADSTPSSRGVDAQQTRRNAPSILNRAYGQSLFWDGRAPSLEEAVVQPIENPAEMALPLATLVERLQRDRGYRTEFARAFPDSVSARNVARALASYVRTLRSGDAPIDRYLRGDRSALSAEAEAGMRLFNGKANCVSCHVGAIFSNEKFHNTGVSWGSGDAGRSAVTGREEERGRFKVPSLRNVVLTAPYMHDGSIATLEAVIEFYDRGGTPNPNRDPEIHALSLTLLEKRALLEFLKSLTGERPRP
jgi:cytochrome c peroxidase